MDVSVVIALRNEEQGQHEVLIFVREIHAQGFVVID